MTPDEVIDKMPPKVLQDMTSHLNAGATNNKWNLADLVNTVAGGSRIELYNSIGEIDTSGQIIGIFAYLGTHFVKNEATMEEKFKIYDKIGNHLLDLVLRSQKHADTYAVLTTLPYDTLVDSEWYLVGYK